MYCVHFHVGLFWTMGLAEETPSSLALPSPTHRSQTFSWKPNYNTSFSITSSSSLCLLTSSLCSLLCITLHWQSSAFSGIYRMFTLSDLNMAANPLTFPPWGFEPGQAVTALTDRVLQSWNHTMGLIRPGHCFISIHYCLPKKPFRPFLLIRSIIFYSTYIFLRLYVYMYVCMHFYIKKE